MRNTAQSVPQLQIVIFRLGSEEFGLDVFSVHEILRYQEVRPVPRAPEFVEGVIDVRKRLIPVVDLRKRFEVPAEGTDGETRIVLVDFGGERLGLIVDAVTEVVRIPETSVSASPSYFRGLAAEYIRGIARVDERLVILLEIERVLSSEERIALDRAELQPTPAEAEEKE